MKIIKRIVIFLCLLLFLIPTEVPAEASLEISVTYGIDGKVQIGKGFPVTVKVINKGDTVSGDLVFFSAPSYQSVGNVVIPVEFPKGEETELTFSIPGLSEDYFYSGPNNQQASFIKFFENGWENGKEIPLNGNTKKRPSFLPDHRIVMGALSDSPDSLNVWKTTKYNGESLEFLSLTKDNFPNEALGLEVFDLILINDYQISNLTEQQLNALVEWTRSGGHLMLGSDPFLQESNELKELFLLHIEGQESFSELAFLTKEEQENLPNFDNVEINIGKLKDDVHVIYSDHSLPMVVQKDYGIGEVTQFAFNLGSETLTKWDGYSSWLSDVLQKTVNKDLSGQQRYMVDELAHRIGSIVELYPSSFIPVKTLVILFIVYLILLIPALYFILKKLDKREISWIIIPLVAIVSSIAIFIVGAKDRIGGSQMNNISILSINDEGIANGYGAFSILSNNSGDYPVTIKPSGYEAFPLHRNNGYETSSIDSFAMVEKGRKQSKITFTDVEYWSIRSAMGPINSIKTGKLESDLWIENNQLKGTVTSNLAFDMDEAYLLSGDKSYPIGDISAGETIDIQIELDSKNIQNLIGAPRSNIASSVFPGYYNAGYGGMSEVKNRESMVEWKKYELLDSSMYFDMQPENLKQPLIAGFTAEPITEVGLDKKVKEINSLSMVTQEVNIEIRSLKGGEFKLKGDAIIPDLNVVSGNSNSIHHNGLMYGENFIAVDPGEYNLSYQLPVEMNANNIAVNKLKVRHPISDGTEFTIYNVKMDEYIVLDDNQTIFEEDANNYISEDGKVLIRFVKNGMNNPDVNTPTLELEGEYNQ
ncbi:DUF4350 domain-containing protein [Paucisalibacillus globulus]|uniref:DUF4350 domain-containing protein n=1 Tax=Paucisalibacillus globulus TaxID=351095 RepID=UPI000423FCAE|nr:DUF4350 domain-containing protein [Paucisalibacillus globulus]